MYVIRLFDNKTMDSIISYLLGATVNSYENVTCKENIFLNLEILKVQGPFQDLLLKPGHLPGYFQGKIKSQDISRVSRTSGHPDDKLLRPI